MTNDFEGQTCGILQFLAILPVERRVENSAAHQVFDLPDLGVSASRRPFNGFRESWHANFYKFRMELANPKFRAFPKILSRMIWFS